MAKYCPIVNKKVVYLACLECEEKLCTFSPVKEREPGTPTGLQNEKENNKRRGS